MKKFLNEFREFAVRGNVIDMAVGLTLGTAFNGIVNSLVNDLFMPVVAALTSNNNFSDLKVVLKTTEESIISINYGQFIQVIINFVIIAFSMYVVVKAINKLKKKYHKEKEEKAPVKSPELLQLEKITQILESK